MATPSSPMRFVALDIHRKYLVVGAVDPHQQVVFPPRRFGYEAFSSWATTNLGPSDAVVLEVTSNAWLLYDELEPLVGSVTVAHPLAVKLIAASRVKTDSRDTLKLAHLMIHSLRQTLAPGYLPLFTSDGLNCYFYAPLGPFWLLACRTPVMRLGTEAALRSARPRLGFSGRLNTAFIERVNLTVRHGVAALARRTWATAKPAPQVLAHLEWWRAYSHCVRPNAALRVALAQPRERGGKRLAQRDLHRTKAPAAGSTHRRWTTREVLTCPMMPIST